MSTHLPGFQSFSRFLHNFVLAKLATSSISCHNYLCLNLFFERAEPSGAGCVKTDQRLGHVRKLFGVRRWFSTGTAGSYTTNSFTGYSRHGRNIADKVKKIEIQNS